MQWQLAFTKLLDRWFWLVAVAIGAIVVLVYTVDALRYANGVDLQVYRAGGVAMRHGIPLYADGFSQRLGTPTGLLFTYPPSAALFFVPMSLLPFGAALVVHELVNIAAIGAVTVLVCRHHGWAWRPTALAALALTAAGPALEPVRETLHFGQINLVLLLMVCADCLLPRLGPLPRGLLTGVAAAVKLTPAVLILFFLARRDWRAAATMAATSAAITLVALVVAPHDSLQFWTNTLFHSDRIGDVFYSYNQSLSGELARLGLSGGLRQAVWALGVLVVVPAGFLAARRAVRAGDELGALLVVAAVGLIASPISWDHHFVWVLLAVPTLALVPRGRRWLAVLAIAIFTAPLHIIWPNTREVHWTSWWQHLTGNLYLVAAIGVVIAVGLRRTAVAEPEVENAPVMAWSRA
ncbi:glycosyltransferase 87 family protein [Labedaea rhizosphaerae]|uniref:Alpha-1,2-mannosyltransferase n=1 Tax=Labedaea rhizosphaerae TaxID=598644 RepID=A0A4V3CZ58_LABRH|nr:glycosyltransferase 87 family protein [Labedaea rhizosphaerae]TDP96748.1 alpha-1,2-mannosyltransferase [Labedaea rhizosphaerae]